MQALIEDEAATAFGADRHQRTHQRRVHRNGRRDRLLATSPGDVQLRIPCFRTGSFFPALLDPRGRIDLAQVQAFLNRALEFSHYPYVYLDAMYLHGWDLARRQVISRAVIVAVGIRPADTQAQVVGSSGSR